MLFTQGNEITRLQCAFVDTPEVERITDFIGSQKAYPEALLLPEYEGEESGTALDDYIDDRDSLFEQAAEVLVLAQQGSARSEEHTSELQSRGHLVCRLLLEKKKKESAIPV